MKKCPNRLKTQTMDPYGVHMLRQEECRLCGVPLFVRKNTMLNHEYFHPDEGEIGRKPKYNQKIEEVRLF